MNTPQDDTSPGRSETKKQRAERELSRAVQLERVAEFARRKAQRQFEAERRKTNAEEVMRSIVEARELRARRKEEREQQKTYAFEQSDSASRTPELGARSETIDGSDHRSFGDMNALRHTLREEQTFLRCLALQSTVIKALICREFLTVPRLMFVLSLIEPVLHIGGIALWHWLTRLVPFYGVSTVLFVSTGLFPVFVAIHLSSHAYGVLSRNRAGRRFPVETPLDLILADNALRLFCYIITGVLCFGAIYLYVTPYAYPFDWLPIILSVTALALLGCGFGMINAAISPLFLYWHYAWIVITRVLLMFSGVLFVPAQLPVQIRSWLAWNPLLQAVTLFRLGFYPQYPTTVYYPYYMWSWSLGVVLVGFMLLSVNRRKIDLITVWH